MTQVKFLKYENKKIPYRVSYGSLNEWQKETGKSIDDLENIDHDLQMLEPLFYHCVTLGYKVNKQESPYTREELEMVLDANWLDFMAGVGDFFQKGVTKAIPAQVKVNK